MWGNGMLKKKKKNYQYPHGDKYSRHKTEFYF